MALLGSTVPPGRLPKVPGLPDNVHRAASSGVSWTQRSGRLCTTRLTNEDQRPRDAASHATGFLGVSRSTEAPAFEVDLSPRQWGRRTEDRERTLLHRSGGAPTHIFRDGPVAAPVRARHLPYGAHGGEDSDSLRHCIIGLFFSSFFFLKAVTPRADAAARSPPAHAEDARDRAVSMQALPFPRVMTDNLVGPC
ncbi:hypothetical protein VTN02DRAFT_6121 [Thermoascus thermophilus]